MSHKNFEKVKMDMTTHLMLSDSSDEDAKQKRGLGKSPTPKKGRSSTPVKAPSSSPQKRAPPPSAFRDDDSESEDDRLIQAIYKSRLGTRPTRAPPSPIPSSRSSSPDVDEVDRESTPSKAGTPVKSPPVPGVKAPATPPGSSPVENGLPTAPVVQQAWAEDVPPATRKVPCDDRDKSPADGLGGVDADVDADVDDDLDAGIVTSGDMHVKSARAAASPTPPPRGMPRVYDLSSEGDSSEDEYSVFQNGRSSAASLSPTAGFLKSPRSGSLQKSESNSPRSRSSRVKGSPPANTAVGIAERSSPHSRHVRSGPAVAYQSLASVHVAPPPLTGVHLGSGPNASEQAVLAIRRARELEEKLESSEREWKWQATQWNREKERLLDRLGQYESINGDKACSVSSKDIRSLLLICKQLRRGVQAMRGDAVERLSTFQELLSETVEGMQTALFEAVRVSSEIQLQYEREMYERRRLFSRLLELSGTIRVFCRVRPTMAEIGRKLRASGPSKRTRKPLKQKAGVVCSVGETEVQVETIRGGSTYKRSFLFDRVYGPMTTQEDVFSDICPLLTSVVDGSNVCLFAYGQTGAGKTFTMRGPREDPGVSARAVGELFDIISRRSATHEAELSVSFVEIYNENVRDLLGPKNKGTKVLDMEEPTEAHAIRRGPTGMHVPTATLVAVHSVDQVVELMEFGESQRTTGETMMNERSSRSHSLMTVVVTTANTITGEKRVGKLHLVDLAGSERVLRTLATGVRLQEAKNINASLAALGDVISAVQSRSKHVPYRNSKLTFLLQDSLSCEAKTIMLLHVAPEEEHVGETLCSLHFGTRVCGTEQQVTRKKGSGSGGGSWTYISGEKHEGRSSPTNGSPSGGRRSPTSSTLRASAPSATSATSVISRPKVRRAAPNSSVDAVRSSSGPSVASASSYQRKKTTPTPTGRVRKSAPSSFSSAQPANGGGVFSAVDAKVRGGGLKAPGTKVSKSTTGSSINGNTSLGGSVVQTQPLRRTAGGSARPTPGSREAVKTVSREKSKISPRSASVAAPAVPRQGASTLAKGDKSSVRANTAVNGSGTVTSGAGVSASASASTSEGVSFSQRLQDLKERSHRMLKFS
eukprot:Rmarinus@m.15928